MSKSIEDLREVLFATLQAVKDGSIDIEKARAVNELGKTICDTARVEVDYLKTTGGGESTFINTAIGADNLPSGITQITRHRLGGSRSYGMSKHGEGARTRLAEFFVKNPHEELSREDAVVKLELSTNTIEKALGQLVGEGLIERVSVYRLRRPPEGEGA